MLELVISVVIILIVLVGLKIVMKIKFKEIKELADKTDLDEITKNLPASEQMTKEMLERINNSNVKVEKTMDEKSGTSLYLVMSNTILLGNMENKYARVQTIAHECLHSIQSKTMLWFNFIYSNFYNLYFILSILFSIFGIYKNTVFHVFIILLLGFVQYVIRAYLETDAMTQAPYLAKDYLESTELTKDNIDILIKSYNDINVRAIPMVNYYLLARILGKVILYVIIAILMIII